MIKVLIVTDDIEKWVSKISEDIIIKRQRMSNNSRIIDNDIISIEIKNNIPFAIRGKKYNYCIVDKYINNEINNIIRASSNVNSVEYTANYYNEYEKRVISVNLNKIIDFQEFTKITSKISGDVYISSGDYKVDGKSIMGIMSLDLSKPLKVELPIDITDEQFNMFNKFKVGKVIR